MCATKFPEIFDALAAEFHHDRLKQKTETSLKTGKSFTCDYITARTVMNRLDMVLGPENWWDDYTPVEHGSICRLTIRLPDGQLLTKVDSGADSTTLKDPGDADKAGMSDAFKRAAVKFGVFRYGYKDGQVVHSKLAGAITQSPPPDVRRAITAPPVVAAQIPAAPVPPPAPAPPAPVTKREEPIPAREPAKPKAEIKTGLQLYRFAEHNRTDPDLVRWLLATFTKFPGKISNWAPVQVAYALPEINEHLEEMKAAKTRVA